MVSEKIVHFQACQLHARSRRLDVCYNIKTSVDAKQHLIVDYDIINSSTNHHQLAKDAKAAKQMLDVDQLDLVGDKGVYVEKDLRDCEAKDIMVFMPIPSVVNLHMRFGVP